MLPPCDQPRVVPRACHWLSVEGEDLLREKLVELGLAETVLAFEVPVDCHGKALVSGLFCVPHKKESDRLIIDRRGPNAHESRLEWARLPHGSLLAQIRATAAQHLRRSGDDLSSYFYLLKRPDSWKCRTCFGRPFKGRALPLAGFEENSTYYLSLRAWAMGDHNSVDVAQCCHEGVLRNAGCLDPERTLCLGEPLPRSDNWEGAISMIICCWLWSKNTKLGIRMQLWTANCWRGRGKLIWMPTSLAP